MTQDNQPVSEHIKKFDQFLVRCDENKSDTIVLSRFRSGLKDELRCDLIVRDISTLEQAIQVVQELDQLQASSFSRRTDFRDNPAGTLLNINLIHPNLNLILDLATPILSAKTKAKESQVSRLNPIQQTQCFKYRGYGHIAQCPSKSRTLIIETQSDSDQDDLDEIVHDPEGDA